eukprot:s1719_g18.t1
MLARSRQQICAGDISEDSENNALASESAPEERQVAETRQGLQPVQSRRGNTVRQRGYASWETLWVPGEKGKMVDGKVDLIDLDVPRGQGLQGAARHERQAAIESANNSQLAVEALQEELQMEKEKLRTQGVLQRAYLQSEISSQDDAERLKAERALEAVRKRSLAKMIHPRILTKVFRAWARTFRQTVEAVSMLKQLPSVDSPRRLRFLIEDAERDSFSVQLDDWLEDEGQTEVKTLAEGAGSAGFSEQDIDDPRSEQEQIYDTRGLLKDQTKAAISSMNKVMEKADAMWGAVRLRISLFRGFSLSRCQERWDKWSLSWSEHIRTFCRQDNAMEHHGLLIITFASWARLLQQLAVTRLAVARSARVSEPFELAEYFYLWQAMQLQSAETDKVLSRIMRGSLALSSAGCGFSGPDLVKLTRCIIHGYVPVQDASWLSLAFFMWFACVHASINERAETTESLRAEMAKDATPESPANAPPQPHPAPDSPLNQPRLVLKLWAVCDAVEEESAEQKELRLVTEAVEKAGSSLAVVRASANTYKIGEKTVQVQLRNDQVLVKQGAAFVPMVSSTSAADAKAKASSTPPSPRGKAPALPSSLAPPKGATGSKASSKASSKAPTTPSPKSKASPSPSPKAKALTLTVPKAQSKQAAQAPVSPRSALAKALAPKAKASGPASLLSAMAKAPQRQ